jgi:hypothetical protein
MLTVSSAERKSEVKMAYNLAALTPRRCIFR